MKQIIIEKWIKLNKYYHLVLTLFPFGFYINGKLQSYIKNLRGVKNGRLTEGRKRAQNKLQKSSNPPIYPPSGHRRKKK